MTRAGKRVLVTGAGGFLGRRLCPMLAEAHHVVGVDLPGVAMALDGERRAAPAPEAMPGMLDEVGPDTVVHAAFRNRKPADWSRTDYLGSVLNENVALFEACSQRDIEVVLCSSSAVYGSPPPGRRILETDAVAPVSLYGVAKAVQEMLTAVFTSDGLRVCTARLFNVIGPGQAPGMLVPDWLRGLAAVADGGEPVLRVHNRATARDFVDVRDAARALTAMVSDFRVAVVNVASGTAVSLLELSRFLETLCPVDFTVLETDPVPADDDIKTQCGDPSRAGDLWGWSPTIPWHTSVAEAWRELRDATSGGSRSL
ncbi:MAG: NAD(P)-dependent oxidoreductase [Acidobacteriota bacterium]|jgi:nucleoside-diphosphate-sugar epimerase